MPPQPSGQCVVCGIETEQRCSSCAEHGFDLFLCGREHQKMIWFAHKHTCGENSKPFMFPPLSTSEVEAILVKHEGQNFDQLDRELQELYLGDAPQRFTFKDMLHRLSTLNTSYLDPVARSSGCLFWRAWLHRHAAGEHLFAYYPLYRMSTLVHLEGELYPSAKDTHEPFHDTQGLFTPFHHLVLVYLAVPYKLRHRIVNTLDGHSPVGDVTAELEALVEPYRPFLRQLSDRIRQMVMEAADVDGLAAHAMLQAFKSLLNEVQSMEPGL